MIRLNNISLSIDSSKEDLYKKVLKKLKITNKEKENIKIRVSKKSIDARNKLDIKFVYSVDVEVKNEKKYLKLCNVSKIEKHIYTLNNIKKLDKRPIIIGAGPCGLFAALILSEYRLNPIIIERGKDIINRRKDVYKFWNESILSEESNVQFGEGGAGTFSDGKLTSGIKDFRIKKILEELVEMGASSEILILQKPHIGTDNLFFIIQNLRKKIISLGGEFRFESKFIGFEEENKEIKSIKILNRNETYKLETDNLILAIGHSARDTFEMLYKNGIHMQLKPFSVGIRIEHNQKFIDESQYGKFANNPNLKSAEYKLASHLKNGRGVYTFCMCPGGFVVAAASEKNRVCTNGMSYYKRDFTNANSALLVSINHNDFLDNNPLSGVKFQRKIEEAAFILGGNNFKAPCQLLGDFLINKPTKEFGDIIPSYKPGVLGVDLRECFEPFIIESLKLAILDMDKKMKGFAKYDAVLTGVETRSSSPLRILRNENFNSNIKGIYPCGEGAGYAGGIISAAVDGIKCAEKIIVE